MNITECIKALQVDLFDFSIICIIKSGKQVIQFYFYCFFQGIENGNSQYSFLFCWTRIKRLQLLVITVPKKKRKSFEITSIQFVVLLFLLSVCTPFSEGHRTLYFQKSFNCDHFLFSFELVYHFAYFVQNTTLSCWQAIYESLALKYA